MPLRRNFNLPKEYQRGLDAVEIEMGRLGLELEKDAVSYLRKEDINVDGTLQKSIGHLVDSFLTGVKLTVGVFASLGGHYGYYVHEGTKPRKKFPPRAPIERWVKKKLGLRDAMEIRQVAFLVSRSIKEKGTSMWGEGTGKGPRRRPFLDFAIERRTKNFARRMEKAFIKGMG